MDQSIILDPKTPPIQPQPVYVVFEGNKIVAAFTDRERAIQYSQDIYADKVCLIYKTVLDPN